MLNVFVLKQAVLWMVSCIPVVGEKLDKSFGEKINATFMHSKIQWKGNIIDVQKKEKLAPAEC